MRIPHAFFMYLTLSRNLFNRNLTIDASFCELHAFSIKSRGRFWYYENKLYVCFEFDWNPIESTSNQESKL